MNYEEPIHRLIEETVASPKWKPFFPHLRIFYNLTQAEYFDLLSEISPDFSIWQTTYFHTMDSHRDIYEWYRSTGLKPYLDVLPEDEKPAFEREIMEKIRAGYPQQRNGKIIFRFPRLFFTAVAGKH